MRTKARRRTSRTFRDHSREVLHLSTLSPVAGRISYWDARRSFYEELLQRATNAKYGSATFPLAAIKGRGGSGKSVALRRLAYDLSQRENGVWWVDRPNALPGSGLDRSIIECFSKQFILVDDIHLAREDDIEFLQRLMRISPAVFVIVAGRDLPTILRVRNRFEAAYLCPMRPKTGLPFWRRSHQSFHRGGILRLIFRVNICMEARLMQTLLVLARRQVAPSDIEGLEVLSGDYC